MADNIKSLAGSYPPINSTTISMFGSSMICEGSVVNSPAGTAIPRSRPASRTATFVTSTVTPTRRRISSALSRRIRSAPLPTVPRPMMPTLILCFIQTAAPSAPREPFPPRLFLVLGITKAGLNAAFNGSKVKRLQDVIECAGLHGLPGYLTVGDCRHHNDAGMRFALHELVENVHTSHDGHA